ncbi:MAG: DUF720 domain-containing protein, partial [Chlamydiia bacterium]|nr:DUF720 domain-containing protein [Chlamydiia bacterium]
EDVATNAKQQSALMAQELLYDFATLSQQAKNNLAAGKGVNTSLLNNMQNGNERISAIRGILEDQISSLRQSAQVSTTNLNSIANNCEQSISEGSGIMQMLGSLTRQIC